MVQYSPILEYNFALIFFVHVVSVECHMILKNHVMKN